MFPQASYFTALTGIPNLPGMRSLAERVFRQVFRRDFTTPGAALLSLGPDVGSTALRAFMVNLKETLDLLYRHVFGKRLAYLSMARFNQQVTTKFHLDGSPDEAYLMLGYEPSEVKSAVSIADFTRAAHEWGIEPRKLLSDFNPMYPGHELRLLPYVTRLEGFDPSSAQVLMINNSSLPYREDGGNVLGVMHQAKIFQPMPDRNRVVNSTMIGSVADRTGELLPPSVQRIFLETQEVAGEVQG